MNKRLAMIRGFLRARHAAIDCRARVYLVRREGVPIVVKQRPEEGKNYYTVDPNGTIERHEWCDAIDTIVEPRTFPIPPLTLLQLKKMADAWIAPIERGVITPAWEATLLEISAWERKLRDKRIAKKKALAATRDTLPAPAPEVSDAGG